MGCCTPPRSIFYNMAGGRVAGRLGVAYRRHADVRRSANDWSIATRRFSPRELFVPFFPSVTRSSHIQAQFMRVVRANACVRERMQILGEQPHQTVGSSSLQEKPFSLSQPIALRLCLRGSSRVDLFTSLSVLSKKWRIKMVLRLRNG